MGINFNNIFFDLDGTLSDSYEGIENGLHFALSKMGVSETPPEKIRKLIGIPLHHSLRMLNFRDDQQIEMAVQYFREYYSQKGIFESRLYPGIFDMIHELSKTSYLYVVTAKPTAYAQTLLEYQGIIKCFTGISGCSLNGGHFSKADFIMSIPDRTASLTVGDRKEDIVAGKTAGTGTCAVLYGYGSKEEISAACPDYLIRSVEELITLLLK